jgi:hypothetical protein
LGQTAVGWESATGGRRDRNLDVDGGERGPVVVIDPDILALGPLPHDRTGGSCAGIREEHILGEEAEVIVEV